jgi:hypothetical protein
MGAEPRKTTLSEHGSFSKSGISTREVWCDGWKLVHNDAHSPVWSICFSAISHSKSLWTCSFLVAWAECTRPWSYILCALRGLEVRWPFPSLVWDDHPPLHQRIFPQLRHPHKTTSLLLQALSLSLPRSWSNACLILLCGTWSSGIRFLLLELRSRSIACRFFYAQLFFWYAISSLGIAISIDCLPLLLCAIVLLVCDFFYRNCDLDRSIAASSMRTCFSGIRFLL